MSKQRLELTWIGKNNRPKLESRILIEDPEKSSGSSSSDTENMLIHGDNLLALKALEQDYSGRFQIQPRSGCLLETGAKYRTGLHLYNNRIPYPGTS